jgi:hypothetical protein
MFLALIGSCTARFDMGISANKISSVTPSAGGLLHLGPPSDREDGLPRSVPSQPLPSEREDLPYKVEIWNDSGASVEQIVAVTANASIGYAAYYAATREFPDRHITLRHKSSVVARWSGPKH